MKKQLSLLIMWIMVFTNTYVVYKAFAVATRARYVKSGCANAGDGTANSCAASGGAVGAYQTITQTIHADASRNLTAGGNNEILDITVSGSVADVWDGDFESIASDPTHNVRIHGAISADGAHVGLRDNARFHILNSTVGGAVVPRNLTGCSFNIENIQIIPTANNPNPAIGVSIDSGCTTGTHNILGNIVAYEPSGTPTTDPTNNGIKTNSNTGTRITNIVNNFVYGFTQNGIFCNISSALTVQTCNIYDNTTVSNANFGIAVIGNGTNDTVNLKNNYMASNTGGQYFLLTSPVTYNHSANITSDTTSPDAAFRSKTCSFVNTGTKDYHLVVGDTNCRSAGTDLAADLAFPVSTDWETGLRDSSPDIGADEYNSIAPTPTPTATPTASCHKGQVDKLCRKGFVGIKY